MIEIDLGVLPIDWYNRILNWLIDDQVPFITVSRFDIVNMPARVQMKECDFLIFRLRHGV